MGENEAIVRIRFWENQEDSRDEYYAVPLDRLEGIRNITRAHGEHSPEARASVIECGRKLEPVLTIDIVEY